MEPLPLSFAGVSCILIFLFSFETFGRAKGDKVDVSYKTLLFDDLRHFEESVEGASHFVLFYTPWCGYCKRLLPVWEELHRRYHEPETTPAVNIARVNCEKSADLCSHFGVTSYPTYVRITSQKFDTRMKLFTADWPEGFDYYGDRRPDAIRSWLFESLRGKAYQRWIPEPPASYRMPGYALPLLRESFFEVTKTGMHLVTFFVPWCPRCENIMPVWTQAAAVTYSVFEGDVLPDEVDCSIAVDVCLQMDVHSYPTILFIKDGSVLGKFAGERTVENIVGFARDMAHKYETVHGLAVAEAAVTAGFSHLPGDGALLPSLVPALNTAGIDEPPPAKLPVLLESGIFQLNAHNFYHSVSMGVTFVNFYAPWCDHCQAMESAYRAVAEKVATLNGVKLCQVDCDADESYLLCEYQGINRFPTIYFYVDGKRSGEYNGPSEIEPLYEAVMDVINRKDEL